MAKIIKILLFNSKNEGFELYQIKYEELSQEKFD
jgi:hypothetical protein